MSPSFTDEEISPGHSVRKRCQDLNSYLSSFKGSALSTKSLPKTAKGELSRYSLLYSNWCLNSTSRSSYTHGGSRVPFPDFRELSWAALGLEEALPGSFKYTNFQEESSFVKTCCFEFPTATALPNFLQHMHLKNSLQGVGAGSRPPSSRWLSLIILFLFLVFCWLFYWFRGMQKHSETFSCLPNKGLATELKHLHCNCVSSVSERESFNFSWRYFYI